MSRRNVPKAPDPRAAIVIPYSDLMNPASEAVRLRIEQHIDRLITVLDALDGDPDLDGGVGDEDCCEACDDDPASSVPFTARGFYAIGDADDAENSGDECEPSSAEDPLGELLTQAAGHNVCREWWSA